MAQSHSPTLQMQTQRRFPSSLRVPDEWFDYKRYGEVIPGTRILAIKTPLKKEFNNGHRRGDDWIIDYERGVCIEDEFTPEQFMDGLASKGLSLAAVIDLTYTNRYYNFREFEERGVKYTKIKCPGKIVPSEDIYSRFVSAVKTGLSSSDDPQAIVAIHCTHGVNRTGYLVCRFLIEEKGFTLDRARQEYQEARGHNIKKYLEDLESRSSSSLKDGPSQDSKHQQHSTSKSSRYSNGAGKSHSPRESVPHHKSTGAKRDRGRADKSLNWRERPTSDTGGYDHRHYSRPRSYHYHDDHHFPAQHPCSPSPPPHNYGPCHSYRPPAFHDNNPYRYHDRPYDTDR